MGASYNTLKGKISYFPRGFVFSLYQFVLQCLNISLNMKYGKLLSMAVQADKQALNWRLPL